MISAQASRRAGKAGPLDGLAHLGNVGWWHGPGFSRPFCWRSSLWEMCGGAGNLSLEARIPVWAGKAEKAGLPGCARVSCFSRVGAGVRAARGLKGVPCRVPRKFQGWVVLPRSLGDGSLCLEARPPGFSGGQLVSPTDRAPPGPSSGLRRPVPIQFSEALRNSLRCSQG